MKNSSFFFVLAIAMGPVLVACSGASSAVTGAPDGSPEAATDDASDGGPAPTADASPPSDASSGAPDTSTSFVSAPHLAWPTIPNHGGHTLDPLRIVTVVAEDDPYASELQLFGDSIPASAWFASFAGEYGLTGTPTHVQILGAHVAAGTSYTQDQMNGYIADTVAAATPSPTPDGHTVYVLFLPPGTTMVVDGAPDTGCLGIPYHTAYGTLGDGMAVLNRCPGSFPSQIDMFTTVAAHEIAEAATDSNPQTNPAWEVWAANTTTPWTSSAWNEVEMENGAEIGDLCIFTHVVDDAISYQRIFSNAAAAKGGDPCVPALSVPYFGVSPDPSTAGWVSVTAGATVKVPLVGWSTAPTGDWLVWADTGKGPSGTTFPATASAATIQSVGSHTYSTTNNGEALTLQVTIPANVPSGWWGAVELWSWHAEANGAYVPGEDYGHESVVGFYVP